MRPALADSVAAVAMSANGAGRTEVRALDPHLYGD